MRLAQDPDHPDTLVIRRELARWRGDAADAELLHTMERAPGPEHPDTLAARRNMAHWRARHFKG